MQRPHSIGQNSAMQKSATYFIREDGPFPKAMLCNLGARMCAGKIICFHDADMIANPHYFPLCVNAVRHGMSSDALCPFLSVIHQYGRRLRNAFIESGDYANLRPYVEGDLPDDMRLLCFTTTRRAPIVIIKHADDIRVGGYDPRFIGWGGEDDELLTRATRLGVRWHSVPDAGAVLFHLHHDTNSRLGALAAAEQNRAAASEAHTLPQADLEARAAELAKYFS